MNEREMGDGAPQHIIDERAQNARVDGHRSEITSLVSTATKAEVTPPRYGSGKSDAAGASGASTLRSGEPDSTSWR